MFSQNGMLGLAATFYALVFGSAGLVFVMQYRRPRQARDPLLMIFPLVYVVGLLFIYVAKFDIYFSVDANGLSAQGLAVGNLAAVMMAMVGSLTITLLSHPVPEDAR